MGDALQAKTYLEEKGAIFDFDEEFVYIPEELYNSLTEEIESLKSKRGEIELKANLKIRELNQEIDGIINDSMQEENHFRAKIEKLKQDKRANKSELIDIKNKIKIIEGDFELNKKKRMYLSNSINDIKEKIKDKEKVYYEIMKLVDNNKKEIAELQKKIDMKYPKEEDMILDNDDIAFKESGDIEKDLAELRRKVNQFKCPQCNYMNSSIYVAKGCYHLGYCQECFNKCGKKTNLKCPRCGKVSSQFFMVFLPK